MVSELYIKDTYLNKNIPFIFNKSIVEYDMKDAGLSLIKEYKLLPKKKIEHLEVLKKKARVIEIGNIQRNDEEFKLNLATAFAAARKEFFTQNDIADSDIISIKKDAIFLNRLVDNGEVGKYINFREKNNYTSYIQLNKMELYYNPSKLDIKGLDDALFPLHEEYIIKFIKSFFNKMETAKDIDVLSFCRRFIDKYKERSLEVGYYREFNFKSLFRTSEGLLYEVFWEDEKDKLDISYNFQNILLKLVQIPL